MRKRTAEVPGIPLEGPAPRLTCCGLQRMGNNLISTWDRQGGTEFTGYRARFGGAGRLSEMEALAGAKSELSINLANTLLSS